ncbi:secretory lipase [Williamsia limnetica]|uniref:Secretory lipase n=1 Tax=Williamsia limnetica TaxID=882452 RepID=A0A318RPA9_WILLI|nr:lipase family protein [Williamsia limnetica]PYE18470.1 secretory lipase [Williamsia limnetica]
MRWPRRRSPFTYGLWVVLLVLGALVVSDSIKLGTNRQPTADPFYSYSGPLVDVEPGTVLRTRPIELAMGDVKTHIAGTQALYRSTDQRGNPTTAVTTMFRPVEAGRSPRIISYHVAYDALGDECDPSYTLRGNKSNVLSEVAEAVIAGYLATGHTVSVPDYEGLREGWTVGRQSGYNALDGVRATEAVLKLPADTPVGLIGYSGGSVPTEWGAEMAPGYAPDLNIVGAAAGGLPVNMVHNLAYVSGAKDWAGVIPALIDAYSRVYALDTESFLSPYGDRLTDTVSNQCVADFAHSYPDLTDAEMVKAPYTSLMQVKSMVQAANDNIMGNSGTPRTPMFLAVGQSDETGDQVMVTADVRGLAHEYCSRGVSVDFKVYQGDDHREAYVSFQRDAAVFLSERFSEVPPPDKCGEIEPGTSLDPLPVPVG